jgi:hypothetical protein
MKSKYFHVGENIRRLVQSTAHQAILWTLHRSYFKGISANIELQV